MSNINVYYKDLESYVIVDFTRGLFIQIFSKKDVSVIRFNRIYAYQTHDQPEAQLAVEHAMILNMFPSAQTYIPLCFEDISGIKISYKTIDEYIVEGESVSDITVKIYNYLMALS